MLKHGEVNPLNVHGLRKLEWCPPHFSKVNFEAVASEKDLIDWIYENLEGRFYLGYEDVRLNGRFVRNACVAFELPAEASYLSLMLPQVNINNFVW